MVILKHTLRATFILILGKFLIDELAKSWQKKKRYNYADQIKGVKFNVANSRVLNMCASL